ncbi:MAG: ABC transporter permease [Chloroflexi bacterium]|nr:ABC transporter permease [Chloroflexota bacterium]
MDTVFFTGLLFLALVKATPIAFGAMAGLMSERSGVINIAIEGMMLMGAMMAFLGSVFFNDLTGGALPKIASLLAGLVVAMFFSAMVALLHALLSIHYKVDQIISGTVINLLAVGVTNFVANAFIDPNRIAGVGVLPVISIPILSEIPFIGRIFFSHQPLVYVMLIMVAVLQYALFKTPWGLRTRAVGEHPLAADTVGINVNRRRYINVTLGGALAGLGGAFLVLESVGRFQKLMTTGRGFIALAALIFGKWTSVGALGSALLFGFAEALGVRLQLGDVNELQALALLAGIGIIALAGVWSVLKLIRRGEDKRPSRTIGVLAIVGLATIAAALLIEWPSIEIPIQFLGLLPFIATVLVLAGFVGRAIPPAAIGKPYEKA